MQATQAAEQARARDLYNETTRNSPSCERRPGRRNLWNSYATAILPQARASVDAALASYRVEASELHVLVDNQMTVNRYAIESVRLLAE